MLPLLNCGLSATLTSMEFYTYTTTLHRYAVMSSFQWFMFHITFSEDNICIGFFNKGYFNLMSHMLFIFFITVVDAKGVLIHVITRVDLFLFLWITFFVCYQFVLNIFYLPQLGYSCNNYRRTLSWKKMRDACNESSNTHIFCRLTI